MSRLRERIGWMEAFAIENGDRWFAERVSSANGRPDTSFIISSPWLARNGTLGGVERRSWTTSGCVAGEVVVKGRLLTLIGTIQLNKLSIVLSCQPTRFHAVALRGDFGQNLAFISRLGYQGWSWQFVPTTNRLFKMLDQLLDCYSWKFRRSVPGKPGEMNTYRLRIRIP